MYRRIGGERTIKGHFGANFDNFALFFYFKEITFQLKKTIFPRNFCLEKYQTDKGMERNYKEI